jgi:hypothetical protein
MKNISLLLVWMALTIPSFGETSPKQYSFSFYGIKDGWYQATVKYTNYSTYTNSTYTLDVKVEYGNITVIDFGNAGSVHTGYNNEGYIYTGGSLNYEKDYEGNIIAATARVTISQDNSMKYFDIRIE